MYVNIKKTRILSQDKLDILNNYIKINVNDDSACSKILNLIENLEIKKNTSFLSTIKDSISIQLVSFKSKISRFLNKKNFLYSYSKCPN